MKRLGTILAIALGTAIMMMLIAVPTDAKSVAGIRPVVGVDGPVTVDVWTDRAEGSVYRTGESIAVYFYASADCYVTIYNIDSEGRVNVLFPEYPDDGFVYGGMTYRLPDYYGHGSLYVSGPRGIEYIEAVATRTPGAFRFNRYGGRYHLGIDPITGDPFEAMNRINTRIIRSRYIANTATTWFFVGSRVWYPRYMCGSCHGRSISFDPYTASCSRYSVHVAGGYDYWWNHSYYPKVGVHFSFGGPFWRFELRTIPVHRHKRMKYIDIAHGYHNYYAPKPPRRPYRHYPTVTSRTYVRRDRVKAYEPMRYGEIRHRKDTRDPRSRDYRGSTNRSNLTGDSRATTSGTRSSATGTRTTTTRSRTSTKSTSGAVSSPQTSTDSRTNRTNRDRTGTSWDGTATSSQTRIYYDGSNSSRQSSASSRSSSSRSRESSRSSYDDDRSSRTTRNVAPQSKTQSIPDRTPTRTESGSRSRSTNSKIQTSRMPSAPKSKATPSRSASSSRSPGSDSRSRQQSSSSSSSRSRTRTR